MTSSPPPALMGAWLTHGDPGGRIAAPPSSSATMTANATSAAWASVPLEPADQLVPVPLPPDGWVSRGLAARLGTAKMNAPTSGLAPVPPVNVTTADVCPPAQFGSIQMAAFMVPLE